MTPDLIRTIAHHRWHALAALVTVVTLHGWLLNGLPFSGQWLLGSVSAPLVNKGLSLTCAPQYQYTSVQGDAVIVADGGTGNYAWDAMDADELLVVGNTALVRYRTSNTSTHVVTVRNEEKLAECLVITP
ncbi:MAG: hypothetical protein AAB864_02735 [Patescibacteria group bacterium]